MTIAPRAIILAAGPAGLAGTSHPILLQTLGNNTS
jgi:hypothetical protein